MQQGGKCACMGLAANVDAALLPGNVGGRRPAVCCRLSFIAGCAIHRTLHLCMRCCRTTLS